MIFTFVWLSSLSMIISRFIQVTANGTRVLTFFGGHFLASTNLVVQTHCEFVWSWCWEKSSERTDRCASCAKLDSKRLTIFHSHQWGRGKPVSSALCTPSVSNILLCCDLMFTCLSLGGPRGEASYHVLLVHLRAFWKHLSPFWALYL